ncbi:shikimate O-hydroxycinnamoyltransferase [Tanacetum coccineum]
MPACMLTPLTDEFVITYTQLSGVQGVDTQSYVIDNVMRQLSFEETELDGEAGFADVIRSGVDSSGLSHDESFRPPVSEEPNVGRTQEPIMAEVSTQEPIVAEVSTQVPIVEEVSTQEPIVAEVSTQVPTVEEVGTQEFTMEDVALEDYVSSGEDVEMCNGTNDDDDEDEVFLVDEENEIVEPDVDVHLFGIIMDLPFDNIGVTNLVPDDVLEGEDVDFINADDFDSDPGNDDEIINYKWIRLVELSREMEGVINNSSKWKYSFYTGQQFTTSKEAKDIVYLHSIKSRRNLKLYKNDRVRIIARCDRKCLFLEFHKIFAQVRVNLNIPVTIVQDQLQREIEVQISMSKAFRAKPEREIRGDHVLQYSMLRHYVVKLQSTNPNTTVKIAVERNIDPSLPTRVF